MPCQLRAPEWDIALWQKTTPVADCLQVLQQLLGDSNPLEASYAAFSLGRWYAWREEWQEAAAVLAQRAGYELRLPAHYGPDLLEVEALTRSGQLSKAWRKVGCFVATAPALADGCLAVANLLAATGVHGSGASEFQPNALQAQRLSWINRVWQRQGLQTVCLGSSDELLTMDNLATAEPAVFLGRCEGTQQAPLVSVIVPAFNAGAGLLTALKSLATQTLAQAYPGALEVIVVDDASTDNTADIAEAFASKNPGFRVLRQSENAGAYAARNRGLSEARGACLTVHDADDWSHPQKLELQWQSLQDNPLWLACNSHWVRCTPKLVFSRWRMEEGWVYRNTSSLLFRRKVFDTLGYWDNVRVEADTEYYDRIRAVFGPNSTGEVLPGVPLAFGRVVPTALTVMPRTHLATQFSGVRADYRKAAFAWHKQAGQPADLYLAQHPEHRPFQAPLDILP
jgi:hypothetical protein